MTELIQANYDHEGKRTGKTAGGTTIDYYFDGDDVIIESQGASIMAYYTQGQGLISQKRGNASYFYHYDGLGSTKALTDSNQNIQASYKYDAWGNVLQTSGTVTNPYLYVGELGYYGDGDSGMYLLTQRWYNPAVGRFVVSDPVRTNVGVQSTTANLYLYVLMNPTKFTDPSGKRISIDNCGAHKAKVEVAIKVICKLLPKRANCIINCVPPAWPGSFSPVNSGIQLLHCLQDCYKWGKVICNVNHPNCSHQTPTGFPCGFSNCDATKGPLVSVEMCVAHLCPLQFNNPWGCFPLYGTIVHEWTHSCGYCRDFNGQPWESVPRAVEDCLFGVYGGFSRRR